MPIAAYFGKARNREFGIAMLGWGSLAGDLALRSLMATRQLRTKGWGAWNWAGLRQSEARSARRAVSLGTVEARLSAKPSPAMAAALAASDVAFIPLH